MCAGPGARRRLAAGPGAPTARGVAAETGVFASGGTRARAGKGRETGQEEGAGRALDTGLGTPVLVRGRRVQWRGGEGRSQGRARHIPPRPHTTKSVRVGVPKGEDLSSATAWTWEILRGQPGAPDRPPRLPARPHARSPAVLSRPGGIPDPERNLSPSGCFTDFGLRGEKQNQAREDHSLIPSPFLPLPCLFLPSR